MVYKVYSSISVNP